jgi:hypothetical protein
MTRAAQGDLAGFAPALIEEDRRQARAILSFALLLAGLAAGLVLSLGLAEADPTLARVLSTTLN